MRKADIVGTRRNEPVIHTVTTQVALLRDLLFFVESDHFVRTCFYAGPTPGTSIGIEYDNAVVPLRDRLLRARTDAWRILAVTAHVDAIGVILNGIVLRRSFFRQKQKFA